MNLNMLFDARGMGGAHLNGGGGDPFAVHQSHQGGTIWRLKVCGLPPITDARLRQIFSLTGQVRLSGGHCFLRLRDPSTCARNALLRGRSRTQLMSTGHGTSELSQPDVALRSSCFSHLALLALTHPTCLRSPIPALKPRQVVEARIVYDRDSGRAAGYAYVSYATKAEAGE